MTTNTGAIGQQGGERTILGHPRGLVTLFFTEMWERFSYYGMRALLVLYLTQHFFFSDERAQGVYGAYAALVYLMPVLGGFLADRFLGARKAVTIGAVLLVLGHFGMAFEGRGSTQVVTISGVEYTVSAEGRGQNRAFFLETEAGRLPASFSSEGLRLEEPGGFARFIPAGEYETSVRRDVFDFAGFKIPVEAILFLSLALISSGVGFIKANISTTVGALYGPGDPRRDAGFTIFYMGINLGSLVATLACGYLGQTYGWWAGFGLAGVGMLLGLVQYLAGQKDLMGKAEAPRPLSRVVEGVFWLLAFVLVAPLWLLLQNNAVMIAPLEQLLGLAPDPGSILSWLSLYQLIVVGLFVAMLLYVALAFKGVARAQMLTALLLIIFSVVFWTLFEQAGSSLSLFAERATDLTIAQAGTLWHSVVTGFFALTGLAALGFLGFVFTRFQRRQVDGVILGYAVLFMSGLAGACWLAVRAGLAGQPFAFTAAQTQSFNPAFVVLLALPVANLWTSLAKRGREPSTPVKFGLALILVGLGFFFLVAGVPFANESLQVPILFLLGLYLLHTTGELFLSPVGLSMVTKLSATQVVGLMMGVWFLASSLAHIVAAQIAQATGSETIAGAVVDPAAQMAKYVSTFTEIGWWGVGAGVLVLALSPFLKRSMHGVN